MIQNQQERSVLNDGIEERYILAADYAGNIHTFYECKRGTLKDEYEYFFLYFVRLVLLTEGLEQLSQKKDIIKETRNWIKNPNKDSLDKRCETGIEMFRQYTDMLSSKGLLALPSRGR